eukprot:scaffold2846_cov322-Pavlova_lutheri.AAC.5
MKDIEVELGQSVELRWLTASHFCQGLQRAGQRKLRLLCGLQGALSIPKPTTASRLPEGLRPVSAVCTPGPGYRRCFLREIPLQERIVVDLRTVLPTIPQTEIAARFSALVRYLVSIFPSTHGLRRAFLEGQVAIQGRLGTTPVQCV